VRSFIDPELSDLNLSNNNLTVGKAKYPDRISNPVGWETDMTGILKLAESLKDMGSLSKFTFSGDHRGSKPVTMEVGMTEADFSGAILQQSGAIILVAWLEHKVQHTTQTDYC
jgi:hypothetical protein